MKYFLDENDKIRGVEEDQNFLVQPEWKELTEEEALKKAKPCLSEKELKKSIRAERNYLLSESDWTVLPDSLVSNKEKWFNYRNDLRNITDQEGFPEKVSWPKKPE